MGKGRLWRPRAVLYRQKLWRFLGVRRRRDHGRALAWATAVCMAMVGLLVATGYMVVQYEKGKQADASNKWGLAIANNQVTSLRSAGGIAEGMQCFDGQGMPHGSADPGAPCSYYSHTIASGCLSYNKERCYDVRITSTNDKGAAADRTVIVTYKVQVTWATAGKSAVFYRLARANPDYSVNLVHGSSTEQPEGGVTVNGVRSIQGGRAITRLSDISGGPGVSITTPECKPSQSCYGANGKYNLTGVFTVATNIPSRLIVGCTWDFGDGSALGQIQADAQGCTNGQTLTHDYHTDWQVQNLPPFPEACFAPLGSGVDTHVFLARVTLHTTEGVDVSSKSPLQLVMPGCA